MKRMSMLLAVATLTVGTTGCGCCSWCLPKPQTHMVAAPVAAPACPPPSACDPCAPGMPVTYGYGGVPAATYTPPPSW